MINSGAAEGGEVEERPTPLPTWDEADRVAALDRYAILDTGCETAFDDVAELAAEILDAPIAIVNFIAAERQWFKAEKGIGVDTAPFEVSICRWAILQPGVFIVPDLTKDARFAHNPLVDTADGLRFYAGALLETPEGLPLGTVCVLDTEARPDGITARQARALQALANQTMAQLELRRANASARKESQRLAAIFAQATVGMSEIGLDGRFLSVNDRLCEILGRPRGEILMLGIPDVLAPSDLSENLPKFNKMVESGESFSIDNRYVRPDGAVVWINSSVVLLVDGDGLPRAAFVVTADITARKEEERERAFLFELGDTLRPLVDPYEMRAEACRLLGEHLGVARVSLAEVDSDPRTSALRVVAAYEGVGTRAWSVGEVALIEDVCARLWSAVERANAEHALKQSEERLRLAVENADVGFWDVDVVNDRLISPPRTKAMFGISPQVTVSMADFYAGLHPDDRVATTEAFAAAIDPERRAPYHIEYRTVGKEDGVIRWVAARGRGVFDCEGRCVRAAGTAIDITARKTSEAALADSEERFRRIADSAPVPMWVTRLDRKREFVNRAYVEFLGRTYAEATDFDWRTIIHPDDAPRIYQEQVVKEAALKPFTLEARYRDARGRYRWLRSESQPRWGPDGRHVGFIGVAYDVTTPKETQIELQAQVAAIAADLDRAWRNASDLVVVIDGEGLLRRVNPATTAILGWTEDEMVGRPVTDFVHQQDIAATVGALEFARGANALPKFENRGRTKTGGLRTIAWLTAFDGAFIYGYGRDVTAEKVREAELDAAREALRQSQKMEAMGQLTGGVAHDFNNLLTPIVASLDMLQRKGLGGEREQRLIAGAAQSAERAKTLVQRLLAFARRQPLQAVPVDVGKLVTGMGDLVSSTTGPQIKVVVDVAVDLSPAMADPNQLEMALLNLAVNARDAMPEGGTLRISASVDTIDERHRSGLKPGAFVRLSVADTGAGMDEATMARAIEPFFSTKGVGKGTGLGLSMVHGLVSQLGGALTIRSRPGLGTNIELWLPISAAAPTVAQSSADVTTAPAPLGTALLVDDEDLVRMSTADMLNDLGYRVVEARNGEEALRLVDSGEPFDLLVSDHLMPGMTGADLAHAVRAARPGVPVLLVSGYADQEGIEPGLPRLAKPFRKDELAASLAELASGSATGNAMAKPS